MIHGRIRKRTGLIRSSIGMTLWSKPCKQHMKATLTGLTSMPNPLEKEDHNPSSFYIEAHLHSPRKRKQLVVLLSTACHSRSKHLKDINIHIHF